MPTEQEMKDLKALEEKLDIELRQVRESIDKIIGRALKKQRPDDRKAALNFYMQQLENVRHYLNPEKRISQYNDLVNGLLNNPQKNLQGFVMLEEQWKTFKFSEAEKLIFQPQIAKLQAIQAELSAKQATIKSREVSEKPVTEKRSSVIRTASASAVVEPQSSKPFLTIDFQKYINQLEKLEKELTRSNQSTLKSMYKNIKKKTLSTLGKQHTTKLEMIKQLKAELINLRNASQNKTTNLSSTQITLKLLESLDRIQQLDEKRVGFHSDKQSPFYQIVELLNSDIVKTSPSILCCEFIKEYANNKYGSARKHFGEYVDRIKDDAKYKDPMYKPKTGDYKAKDPTFKTGDYLNLVYPLPTDERDQLTIDSFSKFIEIEKNKESELNAIFLIMVEAKSISVLIERANAAIQKYKDDPQLLNDALENFIVQIDQKCALLKDLKAGPLAKIEDKETRRGLKSLVTLIDGSVDELRNKQSKSYRPEL